MRPAQADAWGDNVFGPSYTAWTSNSSLRETWGVGANLYEEYNGSGLYASMSDEFTNTGTGSHHDILTIWCDKIPSWFNVGTDTVSSAVRPPSSSVSSDCYLCMFDTALRNVATGQYLGEDGDQNAIMTDTPTTFTLGGDANLNTVMVNNTASYGIWTVSGLELNDAITTDGTNVSWTNSPDSIPSGGQFIMISNGAGGRFGAQFVLSSSVTRGTQDTYGPGGICLADTDGTPTLANCDATDKSQIWEMPE